MSITEEKPLFRKSMVGSSTTSTVWNPSPPNVNPVRTSKLLPYLFQGEVITKKVPYSIVQFDEVVVELLGLDNLDDVEKFYVESNGVLFEHTISSLEGNSFSLQDIFPEPISTRIKIRLQYKSYDHKNATVRYIPYIGNESTEWLKKILTFSRCNILPYKYIEFGLSVNSGTLVKHRKRFILQICKQIPCVPTDFCDVSVHTYNHTLFSDFYPEDTENVVNHHQLALSGHPALLFVVRGDYLSEFAEEVKAIDGDTDIVYHERYTLPEEDQRKYENELALSVELIRQQMLFLKGRRTTLPLTVDDL